MARRSLLVMVLLMTFRAVAVADGYTVIFDEGSGPTLGGAKTTSTVTASNGKSKTELIDKNQSAEVCAQKAGEAARGAGVSAKVSGRTVEISGNRTRTSATGGCHFHCSNSSCS